MQVRGGLKGIFKKIGNTIKNDLDTIIENNVKGSFGKFKNKIGGLLEYSYEKLGEIKNNAYYGFQKVKDGILEYGTIIKDKIEEFSEYLYERLREMGGNILKYVTIIKEKGYKISEYKPAITSAVLTSLPPLIRIPVMAGFYIENVYKGPVGKILKYVLIVSGIGIPVGLGILLLHPIHPLPSNHVQYLGSQDGYEAFVPNGQTISYNGHTDPVGNLILPNGTEIKNVVWDGQDAGTIIKNDNEINELNSRFVGQYAINHQPYVPLQDFYVIKGQVPVEQVTINGQTYYVIDANNINPADIAGFYTYQGWVTNFVEAMNTPGTYAAVIPGNSPVYNWANITGTLVYETHLYQHYYGSLTGGYVLILPNQTIIPYGVGIPSGSAISFDSPSQVYNPSS